MLFPQHASTIERLCALSRKRYRDPYREVPWPEALDEGAAGQMHWLLLLLVGLPGHGRNARTIPCRCSAGHRKRGAGGAESGDAHRAISVTAITFRPLAVGFDVDGARGVHRIDGKRLSRVRLEIKQHQFAAEAGRVRFGNTEGK